MHIWVIEAYIDNKWMPSVAISMTREFARETRKEWLLEYPNIPLRIKKYIRKAY